MKFITSFLLLFSSTLLCADETSIQPSAPTSCPEPKPCCPPRLDCCPPRCVQLVGGPKGEITPNAGPCVACGINAEVTADFIYWKVHEDHLAYITSTGQELTATPTQGKAFQPDFKMEPGFKVGLGLNFEHDGWDSYLQYTWVRARNIKGSATLSSNTIFLDTIWEIQVGGVTINNASVNWDLHYFNVIDLELGRNFYVSRYLQLRPHFGFKGTWQKQFYEVTFQETVDGGPTAGNSVTDFMTQSQFFWGFGMRAGLDAGWHFSKSFSAVGEVAISGLYGQFEVSRTNTSHDNTANLFISGNNSPFALSNSFHTIVPVFEWFAGLRWETYTCDNDYHFSLEAGWEEQFWGDQNQFLAFLTEGKIGNLNFQGLTVKARFDF